MSTLQQIETSTLSMGVEISGPDDGQPVFLLHGFPYDPRCYDEVAPVLAEEGWRVFVPYFRGHGPTRFLSPDAFRSGQQAAIGKDLVELMDALNVRRAVLAGFNWGGRAACIVSALWPERVSGLVSCHGYNIQDIAGAAVPQPAETELRFWYNYYFQTPRGYAGFTADRRGMCKLLWQQNSPTWNFDEATFERTAKSFDNPDYIDVVIHSYRHRYGYASGEPALDMIEEILAKAPPIAAPTIILHGDEDGIDLPDEDAPFGFFGANFTGPVMRRSISGAGHNIPQEAPRAMIQAVRDLAREE